MSVKKYELKKNHTWKAKPGNRLLVLERGLLRFEYPQSWIVDIDENGVHLHDRPPSVESCDLGVSLFPTPIELIRDLPLEQILLSTLDKDREAYEQSEPRHIKNADFEVVWLEQRYIDKDYKRDARFRVALVRGAVLALISMNYWSDRASGLERVWDEVFRTLTFGDEVKDPTAGPVVH